MSRSGLSLKQWSRVLAICLPFMMAALFYAFLSNREPSPFSYKGDMHILASPLAKFAAEGWLSLRVPLLDWNLGDGFNPWLSGQSSVLYPIYPIALLLARALGDPTLLLEATAFLDYLLLAYVIMGSPFFRKWTLVQRALAALLFLVQPSSVILGQNWCYFLNSYVWIILSAHWLLAWGRWPMRTRYAWLTLGSILVLYTAINVQMFAFTMVLVVLPIALAQRDRLPWRTTALFGGIASLLLFPSMLVLLNASMHSNPAWMRGRETVDSTLAFAQSFSGVLSGAVFGNFFKTPFEVWSGVSWHTAGIFWVAPVLPWAMRQVPPRHRRPLLWGLLVLLVIMGIGSFPFLKWLFLGPFARFRWTWKFAIFLPALLLATLALRSKPRAEAGMTWILALSVLMGFGICLRGLEADFMPALRPIANAGSIGLTGPGSELASALDLKPGERIAPVGRMKSLADRVPMPWLAFAGNGPDVFGIPTLAIYEPLESAQQATFRGGLSLPWREALPDDMDLAFFRFVDARLGPLGTRYYLFKTSPLFSGPAMREFRFRNGESVWLVTSERWQPWIQNPQGESAPNPGLDGRVRLPKGGPWRMATSRELQTKQGKLVPGGTWVPGGTILSPRPLGRDGTWVGTWYLTLGVCFLGFWITSSRFRRWMGLPTARSIWTGLRNGRAQAWAGGILATCALAAALRIIFAICFNQPAA